MKRAAVITVVAWAVGWTVGRAAAEAWIRHDQRWRFAGEWDECPCPDFVEYVDPRWS